MTAVVRADARRIPLRDESVALVVTSPPYFNLRSYRDGDEHYAGQVGSEPNPQAFLEALWAITAECWRVLEPSGSMWVNLGDKRSGSGAPGTTSGLAAGDRTARLHESVGSETPYTRSRVQGERSQIAGGYTQSAFGRAKSKMLLPHSYAIGCRDGLADPCVKDHDHLGRHPALLPSEQCSGMGWITRQDQVWSKPNGLPESVKDRTRDSHEYWFHLTKRGDYYANVDPIREPHAAVSLARAEPHRADPGRAHREGRVHGAGPPQTFALSDMCNPLGKLPDSVWSIATQPLVIPDELGIDHFAAFPTEWPRRLILGWCRPGGVVLDPFGGTGTTAMCARALGRVGINLDLSSDYCRLASWRIFESDGASKVRTRTNTEAQPALFDGAGLPVEGAA